MRARKNTAEPTTTNEATWGQRYVGLSLVLLGLSLLAIWYYAGYRAQSFNELLSFKIDDGWCVKGVQSIGLHCFGDYAGVDAGLKAGNLWNPALPTATAYPPISLLPSIAFVHLGRATGSWALGRNLFLLLLAGSILSPAIWVSRKRWSDRGPIAFLLLGIASVPFLIVLDRGNTTGLLIAPLLGVATSYMNQQHRKMVIYIVVCTLLKPQMLLLALLFVVFRKYWHAVVTAAVSVALTFAGFLFFPGSVSDNIHNWLKLTRGYQVYQTFSAPYPYNLGVGRSILTMFDFSHLESLTGEGFRTHLASWLQRHTGPLSFALIALTAVLMFVLRKRDTNPLYPLLAVLLLVAVAPGTSYSYYTALMLVPAAFVLRDPRSSARTQVSAPQWSGILDRNDAAVESLWDRVSRWILIVGLALLLVPLVIPIVSVPLLNSRLHTTVGVGALQLLWGPIMLVLFALTICMALMGSNPSHTTDTPEPAAQESVLAEHDALLETSRAPAPASGSQR